MEHSTNKEEISLLKEILKWIKFNSMPQAKIFLNSVLNTEQKKRVYQLSDGKRNIGEIMKILGMKSKGTIPKLLEDLEKTEFRGRNSHWRGGERFKRNFDLEEVGLLELEQNYFDASDNKPESDV